MSDELTPVLISLNEACRLTSLSRTAVNKRRDAGIFPEAVPLGDRRVAFVKSEVIAWINSRIAARAVAAGKSKAAQNSEASVPGHEA